MSGVVIQDGDIWTPSTGARLARMVIAIYRPLGEKWMVDWEGVGCGRSGRMQLEAFWLWAWSSRAEQSVSSEWTALLAEHAMESIDSRE